MQVVGADLAADAAFEVAIAAEHGADDQVALGDGFADLGDKRAGVADAGGAAVADEVELQLVEIGRQPGLGQILGDDLGAGSQRGLHPRRRRETLLHGFLRHQACGHQHAGIAGVGATGDGGEHHAAVVHRRAGGRSVGRGLGSLLEQRWQLFLERSGGVAQRHAVLRTLGPGDAGLNAGEIHVQHVAVLGLGSLRGVEERLLLEIRLDERDLLFAAAGEPQVAQGLVIHREDAAGGAVLRRHVGDGGAVGQRQSVQAGAEVLDKLAHHALLAQQLGDGEHQVGGGGTLTQLAGEAHADHLRNEHGDRLAEHGGLGLDAAHAPAEHAQAVDHGGVGVGADQRVGVGGALAAGFMHEDHARQVLEVDLVDDAGIRRHDGEVAEGALPPAQEGIALLVALELKSGVQVEGLRRAELIHLHRVVNDQLGGLQGVDLGRIAAQALDGVAHGGQIDHGGDAGEVLHEDAAGHEGDLVAGDALRRPGGQGAHHGGGDGVAVLAAEQVLRQNAQREGQLLRLAAELLQSADAVDFVFLVAELERRATVEAVHRCAPRREFRGMGIV